MGAAAPMTITGATQEREDVTARRVGRAAPALLFTIYIHAEGRRQSWFRAVGCRACTPHM